MKTKVHTHTHTSEDPWSEQARRHHRKLVKTMLKTTQMVDYDEMLIEYKQTVKAESVH